ncbi:MAG TPA: class I mannose-6-phosphate isomerase [Clostridiaceae bacterium]|jgi:mannose-6-phosphate isomerase|nr:class I mannose-6-phosphate isomerase [Clostridiaceae bacterium]
MLYPLKFEPVFKDYIWGGRNLLKLNKKLPEGKVAESWEVSSHPDGISKIANGEYAGMFFTDVIEKEGRKLLGTALSDEAVTKFPLLVKFIDANDNLSVQVHPDENYVRKNNSDLYGKNEMWYIISAEPGARLVYGLKPGTTKSDFEKAVANKKIEELLNYIDVKPGDAINIPTGLVHAIGKGILLAEIQQNSNSTFRVYDYDRVDAKGNPRPLHIREALEVMDFSLHVTGESVVNSSYHGQEEARLCIPLVSNDFFTVEHISVKGNSCDSTDGSKFFIYITIAGAGKIKYGHGTISAIPGDSFLIPAALGKFEFEGNLTMLKAYV